MVARKSFRPIFEALESRIVFSSVLNVPASALVNTAQPATAIPAAAPAITPIVVTSSALAAPKILSADAGPLGISLSWSDRSTRETGFRVFRSTDGINFTQVAQVAKNTTSYFDTDVSPNVTYSYYVIAYNTKAVGKPSKTISATLNPADAPAAPTDLELTVNSADAISLNWADNASNEAGYHVYRSTDAVNYTLVATLSADSTTWNDTSVDTATLYTYSVAAFNAVGEASVASPDGTSIVSGANFPLAPNSPLAALVSNIAGNSLTLSWTEASLNVTGFNIYRSTDGVTSTLVAAVPAGTTTWTDTTLNAGTTYYYSISSWNTAGETVAPQITATTGVGSLNAPSAPLFLSPSNITSNGVTLTWFDSSNNESGFHVYRSTSGGAYTLVANLAANTSNWTDTGLSSSTSYSYYVSSWNSAGEISGLVNSITTSVAVLPAAPLYLSPSNVTSSGVTLAWLDNSNNETGFHVYRSASGGAYTLVADLAANTSAWIDSGLAPSTAYTYYVAAYNANGETAGLTNSITTSAAVSSNPVNIYTKNMTSFTELDIDGTALNDTITVAQTNGVLTITANGVNYIYNNTFGDIVVRGGAGNDTITVAGGVNVPALIYGGDGNDTLTDVTSAKATIVSIGNGTSTLTGNGINTAYWANPGDTINASAAETALGGVNRITNFYQPWSADPNNTDYISRELNGQALRDPSDAGTQIKLTNSSFFGTGATMNDVNQGMLNDCYFVGPLSAIAYSEPARLQDMGVDLGDGTYAVRFIRNGVSTYVRVDGDLTTGPFYYGLGNTTPGATGNLWASIFEKAYAFYRTGANTYSSTNWGSPSSAFRDVGLTTSAFALSLTSAATALSTINTVLSAGRGVTVITNSAIVGGAPLIESHIYTVANAYLDGSGNLMLQLYNPWGVDGFNVDSNPNDGLVTVSYTTLLANASQCVYSTL